MAAYGAVRRPFFCKLMFEPATKSQVAATLCWSVLLFNIGILHAAGTRSLSVLNNAYLRVLRAAAGAKYVDNIPSHTTQEVLVSTGAAPLCDEVRLLRLRYAARVVRHAPPALCAIIDAESQWITDVCADLSWLRSLLPSDDSLPPENSPFELWSPLLAASSWKLKLASARAARLAQLAVPQLPAAPAAAQEWSHFCYQCSRGFATERAWATHAWSTHRRRGPGTALVHGPTCAACLVCFHTRSRVLHHLRDRPSCAERIASAMHPASTELQLALVEEEVAARRLARGARGLTAFNAPAFRVPGPLPEWAS